MPHPAHMYCTGNEQGQIEGSCDITGREGSMLVEAFKHEVYMPRDPQTGLPTGKRVHNPFVVTKMYDKGSPKLYQALTTGEQFSEIKVKWYRINPNGQEEHYFTHTLENAILVSIEPYMPNCLDPQTEAYQHMEAVSFTYKRIRWTWEPDGIEAEDDWSAPPTA